MENIMQQIIEEMALEIRACKMCTYIVYMSQVLAIFISYKFHDRNEISYQSKTSFIYI